MSWLLSKLILEFNIRILALCKIRFTIPFVRVDFLAKTKGKYKYSPTTQQYMFMCIYVRIYILFCAFLLWILSLYELYVMLVMRSFKCCTYYGLFGVWTMKLFSLFVFLFIYIYKEKKKKLKRRTETEVSLCYDKV